MKKFKWFTLLESLVVIGIIGVISTALYNMRNVGNDYRDYRQEAVNVIYKDIAESLKDFQRNKIWKDPQWNEHEIDTFEVSFAETWKLEIWYTYIYCVSWTDNTIIPCYADNWDFYQNNIVWSWYYDSIILISWQKYASKKWIKGIDKYNFLISWDTEYINIYPNGNFDVWEDYIYDFVESIEEMTIAWNQTFTETIWEWNSLDWSACWWIRSDCISSLCTSNNPRYYHHSNRRQAACIRQKTRNISPQDMSTLRAPRHSRRSRRLSFWWMWWANDRRKMDWCLQQKQYYQGGCDIAQRRKNNNTYSTIITQDENYGSTTTTEEVSVYLSFYIYASEENSKSCNIWNGKPIQLGDPQDNSVAIDPNPNDNKIDDPTPDDHKTDIVTPGNPTVQQIDINDDTIDEKEPWQGKPDWTTATKGKKRRPIWKITINSVAKTVSLEWCNNDKYKNWINCWKSICQ